MRAIYILFITIALFLMQGCTSNKNNNAANNKSIPQRIISMAPSITETLFALGLGDRVVGVTNYCKYPAEVKRIDKIGGYMDPNFEAIAGLKPDIVIVGKDAESSITQLQKLEIRILVIDYSSVDGILDSFVQIGNVCGAQEKANKLVQECKRKIEKIKQLTKDLPRKSVLICVGRNIGSEKLSEVYASGKDTFYDELINYAGGVNAYTEGLIKTPVISAEGLVRINPEIIIDLAPDLEDLNLTKEDIIKEWSTLKDITAVKENRVYVLTGDYVTLPGPRFVKTLEDIARVIHPEIELAND
ncbi:MAG: helical backbone metal receptor [Armatimonadota bacterium]